MHTEKPIAYELKPLDKGDGEYIESMTDACISAAVPPEPGTKEEDVVFKIEDEDGALIERAGLRSPFDEECLKNVCDTAKQWLDAFDLSGIE